MSEAPPGRESQKPQLGALARAGPVEPLDHPLGERDQVLEGLDLERERPLLPLERSLLPLKPSLLPLERSLLTGQRALDARQDADQLRVGRHAAIVSAAVLPLNAPA